MSTLTRMKTSRYSRHWDILLGDNADIYLRLWLRHVVMERAEWVTTGSSLGGIHRTIRHNAAVITHCIGYRTWATAQPTRLIPDDYAHVSRLWFLCNEVLTLHVLCYVLWQQLRVSRGSVLQYYRWPQPGQGTGSLQTHTSYPIQSVIRIYYSQ